MGRPRWLRRRRSRDHRGDDRRAARACDRPGRRALRDALLAQPRDDDRRRLDLVGAARRRRHRRRRRRSQHRGRDAR
ncbi:MAG: hypothetical protein EDQ89_12250 [Acidobacteria bacterium]|nr:MAG: hypothetical protein EDQ89_12250 [Acidobacteriota bacterium]